MDILKFDDKYGKELKTQFGLHNTIITFKQIRGKKKKKKKKKKNFRLPYRSLRLEIPTYQLQPL